MPVQRPYNPDARRIAELMQSDLAKVGIKAKIVSYEWGEYRKRVQAGEHQMAELGWTGDNGDPDNFFVTAGQLCRGAARRRQRDQMVQQGLRRRRRPRRPRLSTRPSAPSCTSRRR